MTAYVKLIFFLILFFYSCRTPDFSVQVNTYSDCIENIDTLISMIDHIKYGVYEVDLDRFDVSQYEGLDIGELADLGAPIDPANFGVHLFYQFLRTVNTGSECSNEPVTIEYLERKIGPPNTITHRNPLDGEYAVTYYFNLGYGCPNCSRLVSRIFECCGFIVFIVDEKGLNGVRSNILY